MPHLRLSIARLVTAAIPLAALATAAIALTFAPIVVMLPADQQRGLVDQRGLVLPTWQSDGYSGSVTTQAVSDIAGVGATWVQIVPTWHQATGNSTAIAAGSNTVSDNDVRAAIDLAHDHGLKVLLKPHLDPYGGTPRWVINPSNRTTWFSSYQAFITHYAAIAQEKGVDQFSVGCELKTMTGSADRGRWLTVINAVKAQYSGPLVYAANSDEYANVSFWDALDLIGIDAYFPLSQHPTTDVSAIEQAWMPIRDDLTAFATRFGRRIVFTEAGYPSQVGAAVTPWDNERSSQPAQDEQAAAYEALLATFSDQPWWAGVFWWSWWTTTGIYDRLDYAVQGKLAESVLRRWWA
ncbi:MAG: hypothetical protein JWR37_6053 [Mycobacterium sp.]|nr:hypothetical protein [Mycobacterium sp.]